jgi:hypothetical protein
MAEKTCANCVHVDVCENRFSWLDQEDNTKHIICRHFKDKADVVEVVRCKNCKKRGQRDCIVNRKMAFTDHTTLTGAYDFCSYGERREGDNQ